MVNLLLLITIAQASDVYEVCMLKNQIWSERRQQFETTSTATFYSYEPIQFIVHEKSIEINRDKRQVTKIFEQNGKKCWREHDNSFFCYDDLNDRFEWEFHKRNGDVTRDLLFVCALNGEPLD